MFAYFTFDLLSEQITSIDDNQSYVDDLKKQYGKQQDFFENAKGALGIDFLWWLMPTRPELKTNYYGRTIYIRKFRITFNRLRKRIS